MKKIIHHLRRQPEHIRRHLLHVVIILAGIILLSLWVYSLGTNFSSAAAEVKANQSSNVFSAFKNKITQW